jgi:hypothetical protein
MTPLAPPEAEGPTRRAVIAAAAAITAAPAVAVGVDFAHSADGQIKMEATLDAYPAIWSYTGFVYAVRPGERPRAILGIAGASANWATRQADGGWRMTGATMSFFRDPETAAFLDRFANPFTGHLVEVRPNILSGGGMSYPADGGSPRFVGQSRAGEATPGGFNRADPTRPLGRVAWTRTAQSVMLTTDHAFEVPVQPQLEARTIFADVRDFEDPRVKHMKARFVTSTIVPWLSFMDMADAPGHLVWHCAGEKLFDVADLPADYRARAGRSVDTLTTRPT